MAEDTNELYERLMREKAEGRSPHPHLAPKPLPTIISDAK